MDMLLVPEDSVMDCAPQCGETVPGEVNRERFISKVE